MMLALAPLVTVLIGTSLLGLVAGVLGSFTVLRKRALVGDVLSHAALPGMCIAFWLAGERNFFALVCGAFVTGLAGLATTSLIGRYSRTKEDAALGIVLSTFFGAGVVLSSLLQRGAAGSKAGLETYIFGAAASMTRQDLWQIGAVTLVVLVTLAAAYKEFKLLSFDPIFARAQGWPVGKLDFAMMLLAAMVIVVGLPAVGVVLMAALLITPAVTARLWTERLGYMTMLAGAIGAASGALGTLASEASWFHRGTSHALGLPTGPMVVLVSTAIFVLSLLFAPSRGLVPRWWRERNVSREAMLRKLEELGEMSQ